MIDRARLAWLRCLLGTGVVLGVVRSACAELTREQYEGTRAAALDIRGDEQAIVIGLRESPAPFVHFLQQLDGINTAFTLRLTEFKSPAGEGYELDAEELARLYKLFDRFIPPHRLPATGTCGWSITR